MAIHSISDLRAEIAHLKHQKKEQELAIKERFSSPTAIFDTVFSSAKKSSFSGAFFADDRTRTSTLLLEVDFESTASTNFATPACKNGSNCKIFLNF